MRQTTVRDLLSAGELLASFIVTNVAEIDAWNEVSTTYKKELFLNGHNAFSDETQADYEWAAFGVAIESILTENEFGYSFPELVQRIRETVVNFTDLRFSEMLTRFHLAGYLKTHERGWVTELQYRQLLGGVTGKPMKPRIAAQKTKRDQSWG